MAVPKRWMGRDSRDDEVRPNGKDRTKRYKKEKHRSRGRSKDRTHSPDRSHRDRSSRRDEKVIPPGIYMQQALSIPAYVIEPLWLLSQKIAYAQMDTFSVQGMLKTIFQVQDRWSTQESNHKDTRRDRQRSVER